MGTMAWHKCDVCGKKFAFLKSLQEHQRCHEQPPGLGGAGPPQSQQTHHQYRCENCNPHREFYYHSDYQQHVDTFHCKRFNCPLCKTPFSDVDTLQVHMRVHANENSYGMNDDGDRVDDDQSMATNDTVSVSDSVSASGGNSEFRCSVCERTFPTSAGCARHVTRKHPSVARRSTLRSGGATPTNNGSAASTTLASPNHPHSAILSSPSHNAVVDSQQPYHPNNIDISNHHHHHQSTNDADKSAGDAIGAYQVKNFKLGKSLVISRTVIK